MHNHISNPLTDGFFFPAEWQKHRATWISWPHNLKSWPDKINTIYKPYCEFIREVAKGEQVCINVADNKMQNQATAYLKEVFADLSKIRFYHHPTNDAWCRDHGPAFVISDKEKAIVNWKYNAWGEKYPPYDLDNKIPELIAEKLKLKTYNPGIVMEGGSVDFNDQGIILTTTACLLNENRNPHLNQAEIETYLKNYYGAKEIWWIGDGIVGDDTDGHVDDITRFVNTNTVVTAVESNEDDENYLPLKENLEKLKKFKMPDGNPLLVVELPMPSPVVFDNQRLPASYANFYIANDCVVVPTYRDKKNDPLALEVLESVFTDRRVVGIDSTDIIWGLGSFHCLSQQEPLV